MLRKYRAGIKVRVNRRNQHFWTDKVGSCCVRLHVAKTFTGFKLCSNMQQGVQTDATLM